MTKTKATPKTPTAKTKAQRIHPQAVLQVQYERDTHALTLRAVLTKYVGPTSTRGARIIADAPDGMGKGLAVTFAWDYDVNVEENHRAAALAFFEAMGWSRLTESHRITTAGLGQIGYVHTLARGAR